jgi:hypothetical protein
MAGSGAGGSSSSSAAARSSSRRRGNTTNAATSTTVQASSVEGVEGSAADAGVNSYHVGSGVQYVNSSVTNISHSEVHINQAAGSAENEPSRKLLSKLGDLYCNRLPQSLIETL